LQKYLLEILRIDFLLLIDEFVQLVSQDLVYRNTEEIRDNKFDHIQHYKLILNNVLLIISKMEHFVEFVDFDELIQDHQT
jgi:hypothetical protein